MTDTTTEPAAAVPPMYATRYTLNGRHLFCNDCGTPHLSDTAICVFAAPPTQDDLRARIHMHEIAHVGASVNEPTLKDVDTKIDDLTEEVSGLRAQLDAAVQNLTNLLVQTAIACATCLAEERQQARPGHNIANAIIDGTGYCNEHLDVHGGRLVPRKSSGLIVTGG